MKKRLINLEIKSPPNLKNNITFLIICLYKF